MEEIKPQEQKLKSIYDLANEISEQRKDINGVILAIQKAILDHKYSLKENYQPRSILESRFTPSEEAFEKGMTSCGAMTNIASDILRHIGYKVRLVHGESKESVDHAWISVLDEKTNTWIEFDLTRKGAAVPETNKKKLEVNSWEEMRDVIEKDHETFKNRKNERDLNE